MVRNEAPSLSFPAPPLGRFEIAAVLLTIQGSLTLVAGLIALPFGIAEPGMRVEGLLTILLAIAFFALARGVRRQRNRARRWVLGLEGFSVAGSILLLVLPIGAMRGPVPVMANLLLPLTVILLLRRRAARRAPAAPAPSAP